MLLDPLILSQTVTPTRTPSPREWHTLWTAPKGHICYISDFRPDSRDRQKTDNIESITKKGHQKFSALKWNFFSKKGHSKIWSAKFFYVPPNSAPSLRP